MSALRSPALSKHSRAKSNLQTARARSPTAFHLVSASASGTARAISRAESRSSSCNAKSNLWSGSLVTWNANSFKSVEKIIRSQLTPWFFRHSRQDLLSGGHVTSQYCGLIFNHAQSQRVAGDIHVLIHHIDSALCWNIAEKRHRPKIHRSQRAPTQNQYSIPIKIGDRVGLCPNEVV
jgi:hypothetical protein